MLDCVSHGPVDVRGCLAGRQLFLGAAASGRPTRPGTTLRTAHVLGHPRGPTAQCVDKSPSQAPTRCHADSTDSGKKKIDKSPWSWGTRSSLLPTRLPSITSRKSYCHMCASPARPKQPARPSQVQNSNASPVPGTPYESTKPRSALASWQIPTHSPNAGSKYRGRGVRQK